jgi:hypothetical protein
MVFTGADPEEFSDGTRRLLAEFEQWAKERERPFDSMLVDAILSERFESDGLLGRWHEKALRDLVLVWMPRKITLYGGDPLAALATVKDFLGFLAGKNLLDEHSASIEELHRLIEELSGDYLIAMVEPANFGPAKFWATHMIEAGLNPTDRRALAAYIDQARSGEIEVDQDLLMAITLRHENGDPELPHQEPPRVFDLPGDDELRELAGKTRIVAWLRGLVEWIGEGRALTSKGNFTLPDARKLVPLLGTRDEFDDYIRTSFDLPILSGILEVAKAIDLVDVAGRRLLRGPEAAELLADPLQLWESAFTELDSMDGPYPDGEEEPNYRVSILLALMTSPVPVPMPLLLDVLEAQDEHEDISDETEVDSDARLLADFGLLKAEEAAGEELAFVEDILDDMDLQSDPVTRQIFELLPLGLRAVRALLAAEGVQVTTVEDLATETAEVLVIRLADALPETFDRSVDGWLANREPAKAVAELSELVLRLDDPGYRLAAFQILGKLGEPGTDVIRSLRDHPTAGPSAGTWLVGAGLLAPNALSRSEMVYSMIDMLLAIPDQLVDEFAGEPRDAQLDLLAGFPKSGHPRAALVLEMIASGHKDKVVAKAARKTLYRLNTSRHR